MPQRHFEDAPGLCQQADAATAGFRLNHSMLRIKEPARALDFYTRVLGMRLLRRLDFEPMRFSLYFLGFLDDAAAVPAGGAARTRWLFGREALLELTHNWGTEDDPDFAYHDGNAQPQGFGHIAVTVPDVTAACRRFDELGVEFVKRPEEGKMQDIAFIRDPDGYWIEVIQADRMA